MRAAATKVVRAVVTSSPPLGIAAYSGAGAPADVTAAAPGLLLVGASGWVALMLAWVALDRGDDGTSPR